MYRWNLSLRRGYQATQKMPEPSLKEPKDSLQHPQGRSYAKQPKAHTLTRLRSRFQAAGGPAACACHPTPHGSAAAHTSKGDSSLLHSCQEPGLPTVPSAAASAVTPSFPPAGLFWKAWHFFSCLPPSQWCSWISAKPMIQIQHPGCGKPQGWLQKYLQLDTSSFCLLVCLLAVCNLTTWWDAGIECLGL